MIPICCLDLSINLAYFNFVCFVFNVLDYQPKYTLILTHIRYYGITNIKYANEYHIKAHE